MELTAENMFLIFFVYWLKFITDPKFQWDQPWVRWVAKKCSPIHENIWTGVRIPGAFIVIWVDQTFGSNWLTLFTIVIFVLTDWIDGKVVLAKGKKGTRFGSIYDGVVDRIFIVILFYYFGMYKSHILAPGLFWPLVIIEFAAYIWLGILEKLDKITDKANFYEHLNLGKYKFGIQVCLGIILWAADAFSPSWVWWPLITNVILSVTIIFAVFAAICKYRKDLMAFFADAFTLFNAICGIAACILATTNIPFASMLVNTGAGVDFLDGYIARRTKTGGNSRPLLGTLLDSSADLITFGVAPACIVYAIGVNIWVAGFYALATFARLVRYILSKSRSCRSTEESDEGRIKKPEEFEGYPSTAAGIIIANLAWFGLSVEQLTIAVIIFSILEVSFFVNWYHFKNLSRLKRKFQIAPGLVMLLALIIGNFNLGMIILMVYYTTVFFKPLSAPFFSWDK